MKARAIIRLPFKSEKQLIAIVNALSPEVSRHVGTRSKVKLTTDEEFLVLSVEAEDTVALRAALNSFLRWINSAMNVLETMKNES